MVKSLLIHLDDKDYKKLRKVKTKLRSWSSFILTLLDEDSLEQEFKLRETNKMEID